MLVDELVDRLLVDRLDLLELQPHADAPVAPRDAAIAFDVRFRSWQSETDAHLRMLIEWTHRADGHAALAQVQGECRRDSIAKAVGDRNTEHDARAAAAVEVIGGQLGGQRREDVLHRAVLVHVPGAAERGEIAHLSGGGDRAAEHQDRQPAAVDLADTAHQLDAPRVRQPQIQHEEVELGEVLADMRQQFGGALDRDRFVAGAHERRGEPIAHERGVVGDDDGLIAHGLDCAIYQVLAIIRTSIGVCSGACMATCPECDAEIEVDEFDVDKGDLISCPDCGSNLEVTGTSPIELDLSDEDEDDDEEDEKGDDDEDGDEFDDEDEDDDDAEEKENWDE